MRRRSPRTSGRAGGRGFWTEARIAELTQLWAAGVTGSAIAERLGSTKDAVVSKARRLKLDSRLPEGPAEPRPSRLERRLAILAAATGATAEDLLRLRRRQRPQPRGRLFADCQFMTGEGAASGVAGGAAGGVAGGRRCGEPVVPHVDNWPYCAEHLARCRRPRRAAEPDDAAGERAA